MISRTFSRSGSLSSSRSFSRSGQAQGIGESLAQPQVNPPTTTASPTQVNPNPKRPNAKETTNGDMTENSRRLLLEQVQELLKGNNAKPAWIVRESRLDAVKSADPGRLWKKIAANMNIGEADTRDGKNAASPPSNRSGLFLKHQLFIFTDKGGYPALIWAARQRQVDLLKLLLENGADRDADKDLDFGRNALHWAAWNGDVDVVRLLFNFGTAAAAQSLTKAEDIDKKTPLHLAAEMGHSYVVELLLEHADRTDAIDHLGRTAMHWAAENGHLVVVWQLVRKEQTRIGGSKPISKEINIEDVSKRTPLWRASRAGMKEVVDFLLKQKKELLPEEGGSELQIAAERGHAGVVESLLQHKANIRWKDGNGLTALHWAAKSGHNEVILLLLKSTPAADANARDGSNRTPLMLATREGKHSVVKSLLEKAACDLTLVDNNQHTALFHVADGHRETLRQLSGNRKVNDKVEYLRTLTEVLWPPSEGYQQIVWLLVDHVFSDKVPDDNEKLRLLGQLFETGEPAPNDKGTLGQIALRCVIAKGHAEAVSELIGNSVDVGARDEEKRRTALHVAAWEGKTATVDKLIPKSDLESKDKDGRTALHLAVVRGNVDMVKYLLQKKVNTKAQDYYGFTALHLAVKAGHDITQTLEAVSDVAQKDYGFHDGVERTAKEIEDMGGHFLVGEQYEAMFPKCGI